MDAPDKATVSLTEHRRPHNSLTSCFSDVFFVAKNIQKPCDAGNRLILYTFYGENVISSLFSPSRGDQPGLVVFFNVSHLSAGKHCGAMFTGNLTIYHMVSLHNCVRSETI